MRISPVRIAAIDLGTNSFHLFIAKLKTNGKLKLLERQRELIRLGSLQLPDGNIITRDEIDKAIQILKNFKTLAAYHSSRIRAVATSAVREAINHKEFINEIFKTTGILVEPIEGKVEGTLIFNGVKNALPTKDNNVLCIDIGGGSTEFVLAEKDEPVFTESIKIGAVRLMKKHFQDSIITDAAIEQCSIDVEKQIKQNNNIIYEHPFDFAVGTSGTIATVCLIKYYQYNTKKMNGLNGFSFSAEQFEEIYERVMNLKTPQERSKVIGIDSIRADIIPAGFIILKKSFELFKIKKMVFSGYALREGMVYDSINKSNLF